MKQNIKINFFIGQIIEDKVKELNISTKNIMIFFRCSKDKVKRMYMSHHLSSDVLFKWSIFLNINLFDLYSEIYVKYKKNENEREID